ncbi:hypothetical protein ACUOFU_04245 [Microbacterium arabinogalactanolyticum]|uniref:hypothetical protein n=1 Tax=Microbacterium arabinogalactanolyticum TaxID=69365 RepID=UPI004043DAB1
MTDGRGNRTTVVVYDPKTERGGGQVVLENILARMAAAGLDARLVMPEEGQGKITIPDGVRTYASWGHVTADPSVSSRVLLVSNANSGMPALLSAAKRLGSAGRLIRSTAIVHNYPLNVRTAIATRHFLKQFDEAVVVEPGLVSLRADAQIPGWLSLNEPLSVVADYTDAPIRRTGKVKSYGRPDRMKGLDLLPGIFGPLTELGYECEVAIGSGFMGDRKYVKNLRAELAPWLVDGPRNSSWIEPGDVFLIPSRFGEAACLLAQEVLSRGAFAIAGRVGLMPYLSPDGKGMRTFAVDDIDGALRAAQEALTMPGDHFADECLSGVALIEHRAGAWHEQFLELLNRHAAMLEAA